MGPDKENKREMMLSESEENHEMACFAGKNEQTQMITAIFVFVSLALHASVAACLVLLLRESPMAPQRFSTAMQVIPIALDAEDKIASSVQPPDNSVSGKARKNSQTFSFSNNDAEARTKNNERKSSSPEEAQAPEAASAIPSDAPSSLIVQENILGEESDYRRNLTKSQSSSAQTMPRYLKTPNPPYPPQARIKGYDGVVLLRVEVLKSGRTGHISIKESSGHDILDKAALDTVAKWQFEPGRNKGEVRDMTIDIPVRFSLRD